MDQKVTKNQFKKFLHNVFLDNPVNFPIYKGRKVYVVVNFIALLNENGDLYDNSKIVANKTYNPKWAELNAGGVLVYVDPAYLVTSNIKLIISHKVTYTPT